MATANKQLLLKVVERIVGRTVEEEVDLGYETLPDTAGYKSSVVVMCLGNIDFAGPPCRTIEAAEDAAARKALGAFASAGALAQGPAKQLRLPQQPQVPPPPMMKTPTAKAPPGGRPLQTQWPPAPMHAISFAVKEEIQLLCHEAPLVKKLKTGNQIPHQQFFQQPTSVAEAASQIANAKGNLNQLISKLLGRSLDKADVEFTANELQGGNEFDCDARLVV
ncbi:unnamed protein product [Polarella glacialis]|uniref:Uncharacterized protein n=1 Tax=Polarella glacialis TaxID=89957 RepID=A0A813GD10_POLGL|nr:unnamed protein product [Polarella glacialis]